MNKPIAVIRTIFLHWAFCVAFLPVFSQQTASPFDLLPRLPQSSSPDSAITITSSSNPFDINRIDVNAGERPGQAIPQFQVERKSKPLSAKEKSTIYQRFLFVTIMSMMVLLTLVITISGYLFQKYGRHLRTITFSVSCCASRRQGSPSGILFCI